MVKKTNLLVVATLIFLTAGTAGCGPDTDIQGKKLPADHPYRSGTIAGVVFDSGFDRDESIRLLVRDDKQLTTYVILNYKPDMENIFSPYKNDIPYNQHLANVYKKHNDLKMAFNNKYHGTRVECEIKDFLLAPESEKEPGVLGGVFGRCKQKGESIEDWLLSESMVVPTNSAKAFLNPAPTTQKKRDPFFRTKYGGYIPKDYPWRSKKIAGTVVKFVVTPDRSVAAHVKNDITGDITAVLIYHNIELNVSAPDHFQIKKKMEEAFNNKYKGKKAKCNITAVHDTISAQEFLGTVAGVCKPGVNEWVKKEIDRIMSERNVSGGEN